MSGNEIAAVIRPSLFLGMILLGSSLARPAEAEQLAVKPNVIIILADDLGYGDLSCYGHPRFKTQNLDRMATEGVRMTQLNTPMPFCAPTRAALLTGRYPFRCGLTSNPDPESGPESDVLISMPAGAGDFSCRSARARATH